MEALIQTIENLKLNPVQELIKLISDSELQEWVIDTIKERQLFEQGIGEENIIIGYYSPYTESINPDKQAYTHYTLKDSGEFYASMRIVIMSNGFLIDAEGQKDDKNLFEVYGQEQNLLGFNEINLALFLEMLGQKTLEEIHQR